MENKFQEALNNIVYASCPNHTNCKKCGMENICNSKVKEWVDTLQELINQQGDYMSYQDLKAEYEGELQRYKKAFDIACSMVEDELLSKDGIKKQIMEQAESEGN